MELVLNSTAHPSPAVGLSFLDTDEAFEFSSILIGEAILLAVTASMVNARADGRTMRPVQVMQRYFPSASSEHISTRDQQGNPQFFSEALTAHAERIASEISALRALLPPQPDAWTRPLSKGEAAQWKPLQAQVRAACSSLRILLLVIGDRLIARNDRFTAELLEADHLLKAVLRGMSPCVRSDGLVIIPQSDDRRRERRVPILLRVELLCDRGHFRPLLRDVSPSGFGLSEAPPLAIGTQVAVKLATQRMLVGVIRWCHGGHIGAQLLERLPLDDELLQEAWSRVSKR